MTTFAIIGLTVLGTILIFILIIGLIGTRVSIEEMDSNKVESFLSDKEHFVEACDINKVIYKSHSELTDNELEEESECKCIYQTSASEKTRIIFECNNCKNIFKTISELPTELIEHYLDHLPEYKAMVDKTPDKFLDFHFQNSIRDEQYELSQYISDVAKKRGITLKAELN